MYLLLAYRVGVGEHNGSYWGRSLAPLGMVDPKNICLFPNCVTMPNLVAVSRTV